MKRHTLIAIVWLAAFPMAAVQAAETPWQTPLDVEFKARLDGSGERYVLLLPKAFGAGKPVDLVVALHGHGSDRWQFVQQQRDECRGVRDVAAREGMIFVSPDYRAKTSWMGPAAEADVVQIIHDLKGRHRIGGVVLAGGSMGATGAPQYGQKAAPSTGSALRQAGQDATLIQIRSFPPGGG